MYVCVCNAINERSVAQAIEAGASKVSDIYRANGCAPRCGKCVPDMRKALGGSEAVELTGAGD